MGLFDPWMMGQSFGGILGGVVPNSYDHKDIEALIRGYGPQWGNLPAADAPQIPMDPSGGSLMGAAPANPYGSAGALMPSFTSTVSTEGAPPQQQAASPGGPWIRPGSFFDKLLGAPQMAANAAPSPQQQPNMSGAEPSAVWGGPQMANVPMPQPRPPGLGEQPQQSILPPNAQLTQGPAAPQQLPSQAQPAMAQAQPLPQPGVGMGDRFSAFANNLSSGGNPIAMLANAAQGLSTGKRFDAEGQRQQNQAQMAQALHGALVQRGIPPQQAYAIATAAATDPKLAEQLLPQALGLKPPSTIEGVVASDMYRGGQNGGGAAAPSATGLDALRKLESAKAQGTKEGGVIGETQATAELNLPSAVAQAKEGLRLIGELRTHRGRDNPIFWHAKTAAYLPDSAMPGNTDARDANSILQQIKGGAFLEAFKSLKGGGAITEVEGKKATDAITRMDRSQSRAEFDKALSDYEGIIKLGIDRANQQAGRPAPGGFKGNSEWQQVQPGVRIRQVQ